MAERENDIAKRAQKDDASAVKQRGQGITIRGMLVGLVFVAVICVIVSYSELVIGRIQIGFLQMPPAAIGIFFFLVMLNRSMQRLGRRLSLSGAELMMIYCMMIVAAMISSRGIMERLIPLMVTTDYFANQGNNWQGLFFPHIKKWMVAFDPKGGPAQPVAQHFFEGLRDGAAIPWNQWIVPLAAWGALVLLVIFAFLCIATILRRQWVDNEKLPFPLVQPPLLLAQGEQSPFSNRLFVAGLAVPAFIFTLNGLHMWYPAIPEATLQIMVSQYLVNPPWNSMYFTCIYISFAAIGFFFLLPSELLFSIWFFAVFARLEGVFAASLGMDLRRMPVYGTHLFVAYQTAGAYFVLAGYLLYVSLPHLKKVFREAIGREKPDDSNELLPYRTAFWGLIISFALIIGWTFVAGMSPWLAVLEFGVFLFIIALVMTRSTAEAGMLMTETSFRPIDLYAMFAPVSTVGPANITLLAFFDTMFLREQRGLLLTGLMDGLKISDGVKVRRRSLLPVFVLGILAALVIAGYIHMWIPYNKGGITLYEAVYRGHNIGPLRHYQGQFGDITPPTWQGLTFFLVGAVVTVILAYMRAMFYWWPFHPLGYALSVSWTSSVFWFSCLVAWMIKSAFIHYGGMKLYIKARPFFLGLILGEFGMAVIWALIGAATGAPTPEFPWP